MTIWYTIMRITGVTASFIIPVTALVSQVQVVVLDLDSVSSVHASSSLVSIVSVLLCISIASTGFFLSSCWIFLPSIRWLASLRNSTKCLTKFIKPRFGEVVFWLPLLDIIILVVSLLLMLVPWVSVFETLQVAGAAKRIKLDVILNSFLKLKSKIADENHFPGISKVLKIGQ